MKNEPPHVKHHSMVHQFKKIRCPDDLIDFEVLTYNVGGDERKRQKFFNNILKNTSGKSIICLQETHSTHNVEILQHYQ